MHEKPQRFRTQKRSALLWTLLFFAAGHGLAGIYLHKRHPEFFDAEMTLRFRKLPEHLAQAPGRPLAVALGSSRFVFGLCPASVMEQAKDVSSKPLFFNFSMLGAGPVGQRMILQRLLHQGCQPQWLFLEVWPPFWTSEYPSLEAERAFSRDMYWSDVPIVGRLYKRRWDAIDRVITQTLIPLYQYRDSVCRHYFPKWLPVHAPQNLETGFGEQWKANLDDFGWVEFNPPADSSLLKKLQQSLKDCVAINTISHRALDDLLQECRNSHIQVVFLLMPDHSSVRNWYPLLRSQLRPYLRRLSRENHAPIVDARNWQPDENLPDGCHLSSQGAQSFSSRLGREVYAPLLRGQPLAENILWHEAEEP